MQSLTDEQLVDIYQQNTDGKGQLAFYHLYHRYAQPMFSFFYYSLMNDYAKAQDFVHDLFVKIIEKRQHIDNKRSFKAWLYTIASNMCKNEFRNKKVMKKYTQHIKATEQLSAENQDTENLLRTSIDQLNQEHRSLIILRFKMKLSVKEIADMYECPEGTIKSRLFYATKELTRIYKQ